MMPGASLSVLGAFLLQERWIESLCEQVMCIITAENCKGFGASLHLQLACLLAFLPFRICHAALFFEHHQKLFVGRQRLLGILNVFFGLGIFLISVCKFLCLAVDLGLAGLDL